MGQGVSTAVPRMCLQGTRAACHRTGTSRTVAVAIRDLAALQPDHGVVDAPDEPLDLGRRGVNCHGAMDRPFRVVKDAIEASLVNSEAGVAQHVHQSVAGGCGDGIGWPRVSAKRGFDVWVCMMSSLCLP